MTHPESAESMPSVHRRHRRSTRPSCVAIAVLTLALATPVIPAPASATVPGLTVATLTTALPAPDGWGGRATAAAVDPTNPNHALIASESGGLWVTADNGGHWAHVDQLPPFRLSDVRFSPDQPQLVLVTATGDLSSTNGGGIWRSTDGGVDWAKPVTAEPPTLPACPRPSAWGISWAAGTATVAVGTDCGVAVSTDRGATWHHTGVAAPVYSVLARTTTGGVVVDTCAADGFRRSTNGGTSFGTLRPQPVCQPGQSHGIAGPADTRVVFAAAYDADGSNSDQMESDNGGTSFATLARMPHGEGRWPVVAVIGSRDGTPGHVDLWFSSGYDADRVTCTGVLPAHLCRGLTATDAVRVEHSDINDFAFANRNCVRFIADDGGIEGSHDCGLTFDIEGAGRAGYDALQVYSVAGQSHLDHTDLYFGTQDNATWASNDGGLTWPGVVPGRNPEGLIASDGLEVQAPPSAAGPYGDIVTVDDSSVGEVAANRTFTTTRGWTFAPGQTAASPPWLVSNGVYVQWGSPGNTLWLTADAGSTWRALASLSRRPLEQPSIATSPIGTTLYQAVDRGAGRVGLVRVSWTGTGSGAVTPADTGLHNLSNPALYPSLGAYFDGAGTFRQPFVYAVDPFDPAHLIAADLGRQTMVQSHTSGTSWTPDSDLTALVTAHASLVFSASTGAEPHIIDFDPAHSGRIYVGTESAGTFYSADDGTSWDNIGGGTHVTAASGFFFDSARSRVVVASYGRGLWQIYAAARPGRYVLCISPCRNVEGRGWIDPAHSLPPDTVVSAVARVLDGAGLPVAKSPVWLSFTATAGGGAASALGAALTATPREFFTDSAGTIALSYSTPAKLPLTGTDLIILRDAKSGGRNMATLGYSFTAPGAYAAGANPIAKTGSLNFGDDVPVQLSVTAAGGRPAVPGAGVFLWLASNQARSDADVNGTPLTNAPSMFFADSDGRLLLHYRGALPTAGTDIIEMADDPKALSLAIKLSYTGTG